MQSILNPIIGPKDPQVDQKDLSGRVALVTGGANGIGFQVAKGLVSGGCRVVMVNRKEEQGNESIEDIKKEYPNAQIEWFGCDFGNLSQVKETFSKWAEKEERLDFLVLSAGINSDQFGLSHDQIDRHFSVNWLGQFYAINLLWSLIRKTSEMATTPPPRICFESSEMHRGAPSNVHYGSLDEINDSSIGSTEVYGRTKLAMILGSKFGLVERVVKKNNLNIYVHAVHPGIVNTQMQQQWKTAYPGLTGQILTAVNLALGRDIPQGAASALWMLTSEDIEKQGDKFFYWTDPAQPGKESKQADDKWLGAALWDLSHRMVKQIAGDDAMKSWDA